MREVGTLVWVILIVIGVVGSMISSVRRQAQAQRRAPPAGPPRYPAGVRFAAAAAGQPRRVGPPPAEVAPTAGPSLPTRPTSSARLQPPPAHSPKEPKLPRPRLFAGKGGLVRAVIAAEVLGKPRGLSDEMFPH